MRFKTEEDVLNKLVIPFLTENLGLNAVDMDFQRTLKLRLGLSIHEIDSRKQPFSASWRHDVLVKSGETNLFIIEVKGSEIKISLDDAEQAISYARLVHPIAPIAMVTNGRDWKIYDTVSKIEIPRDDPKIKGPYKAELPDEKYFEAMRYFFGLSAV